MLKKLIGSHAAASAETNPITDLAAILHQNWQAQYRIDNSKTETY